MNCIIIEDQPPAQRILQKYIEDLGSWQLRGTFPDALQAQELLQSEPVDLILLDIHLPKLSGIDFLKTLPNPPAVILTTAFPDYALESYELDVVDYLLKPFSFQRFVHAVAKVPSKREEVPAAPSLSVHADTEIFIKSGYEYIRLPVGSIIYIRSDADYTEIHLAHRKHLSSEPLRYWEEKLAQYQFVRVHRSYVINAASIKKIAGSQVYLAEEVVVPMGRAYKDDFIRRFVQ